MRAGWLFIAIVGSTDCGSVPADVDAAALDATTDDVADACSTSFSCFDVVQTDAPTTTQVVCPDGGFITINGDGDAETLSASFDGVPVAYYVDCCGYRALAVEGSEARDGGAAVQLQQAGSENPDGGFTFIAGPSVASYYRADGSVFSTFWSDAAVATFTQIDPPGGVVAGSYAITVASSKQPDAATLTLSGTFVTCRIDDAVCLCPPPPP